MQRRISPWQKKIVVKRMIRISKIVYSLFSTLFVMESARSNASGQLGPEYPRKRVGQRHPHIARRKVRNRPEMRQRVICDLTLRERTRGKQPMNLFGLSCSSVLVISSTSSPTIAPRACTSWVSNSRGSFVRVSPEELDILSPSPGTGSATTRDSAGTTLEAVCSE